MNKQIIILLMLQIMKNFFLPPLESYKLYLLSNYNLDPKKRPQQLLTELSNKKTLNLFLNTLNVKQQNGIKLLRILTILHWTVYYEPELCDYYTELKLKTQSTDDWLNKKILKPYLNFIYKISSSYEMFLKTKKKGIVQFQYQLLFYITNLLNQLFNGVKKMSSLARYYIKNDNSQIKLILNSFVLMNAYHAQQLYNLFKIILQEIIRYPQIYIKNLQEKQWLKYLIFDHLQSMNQNMKSLLLDKYFFPYNKGYGVILLKVQELDSKSRSFVDKLLYNQAQMIKSKKSKQKDLESIIYDKNGNINPQLYQSLRNIKLQNESIRANRRQKDTSGFKNSLSYRVNRTNQEFVQDI